MSYEEFLEEIMLELKLRTSKSNEYSFELTKVMKTNQGEIDAIRIQYKDESQIMPMCYPSEMFVDYLEWGGEVDDVVDEIMNVAERGKQEALELKNVLDELTPEYASERLILHLYNREWNEELLKNAITMDVDGCDDLIAVARWIVPEANGTQASILVTKELQQRLAMTTEELLSMAYKNTINQKFTLESMGEVLGEMLEEELVEAIDENKMYVLSNEKKFFGANVLLNKEQLQKISSRIGRDYYLLPSSIHELIILPLKSVDDPNPSELQKMVLEVNESCVDVKERLGENVYHCVGNKLFICNSVEEAIIQRESVLENQQLEKQEKKHSRSL